MAHLAIPHLPLTAGRSNGRRRSILSAALTRSARLCASLVGILIPRERGVDRDIARLIERSGGKFTDSLEREVEQSLFGRGRF